MAGNDTDAYEFGSWEFFSSATVEDVRDHLAAGCDPNERDEDGGTPLYHAASTTADPAVITALLDAGADARACNNVGITILHSAAGSSDEPRVLELLIGAGADPNARSDSEYTPLHRAAELNPGNPAIIEVLVGAGADPDVFDKFRYTPLLRAASNCEDPAVIKALIEGGADPDLQGVGDLTALHLAVSSNSVVWGANGRTDIAEALIRAGADPNVTDDYGFNAMHFAASRIRTLRIFELLVEAGADLTARDRDGKTPLQVMNWKKDKPQIVEYLKRVQAQQKAGPRSLLGDRLAQVRKKV